MAKVIWNPLEAMPNDREYEVYHVINEDNYGMPAFHAHHFYEFFIYVAGNVNFLIEDILYTPEAYDLFIYPPGIMHRWMPKGTVGRYERFYAYVSRSCLESMSTEEFPMAKMIDEAMEKHQYCFRLGYKNGSAIATQIDEISRHFQAADTADRLLNRCRLYMLLISVCRLLDPVSAEASSLPSRLRDIISYINEHITESLSLDMLAEQFLVSKYYLLHTFKEYTNLSVYQYIIGKRISHAQNLMHEGMPPGNAAQASGFNDYAGFYRAFVKQVGVTPQAFCRGEKHKFFHPIDQN